MSRTTKKLLVNNTRTLNIRGLLEKYPTVFFYANT
jgi:hypothetical protein